RQDRGPDAAIEHRLVRCVGEFDHVVTMGSRAIAFYRQRGVGVPFTVISGGVDASRFSPSTCPAQYDLILVRPLAEIKRIDVFLETVRLVRARIHTVTAAIVGDGELRDALQQRAAALGIDDCVHFAGHSPDVVDWLRRARIFVLTSDSEGLALSLVEAM